MTWRFSGFVSSGKYAGPWRTGNAIRRLALQVDDAYPSRSKSSDGTLGNTAHSLRRSDHNPWIRDGNAGIVTAIDITHDTSSADMGAITEAIRLARHPAVKYVIYNRRIFSATKKPWQWRRYFGVNPHRSHAHISVQSTASHYDDLTPWPIEGNGGEDMLKQGDNSDDVKRYQDALNDHDAPGVVLVVDGDYGPATATATAASQAHIGFTVNGAVASAAFMASLFARQHPTQHSLASGGITQAELAAALTALAASSHQELTDHTGDTDAHHA